MKLQFVSIAPRAGSGPAQVLLERYTARVAGYLPVEAQIYRSEEALFEALSRQRSRTAAMLVLLDGRGRQMSSEALASWVGAQQDSGRQLLVFAVGPADGWTDEARTRAGLLLSLGAMTLPHELARVVLAEQVYRAFAILAGHPYHAGHNE